MIVELGANDALRGVDPAVTRDALDRLLARLGERGLPVLLAGMRAPPNLGAEYAAAGFDPIYPDLARDSAAPPLPVLPRRRRRRCRLSTRPTASIPLPAGVGIIVDAGSCRRSKALIAEADGRETKTGFTRSLVVRDAGVRDLQQEGYAMPRFFTGIEIPAEIGERLSSSAAASPAPAGYDLGELPPTLRFVGDIDMDIAARATSLDAPQPVLVPIARSTGWSPSAPGSRTPSSPESGPAWR